jgi:SET domain-containing protein
VFLTSDGKGWGLRTLEDLPKGAFVCEFVGEILTVEELHERNLKYPKSGKYTYPILLDAEWNSGIVKDNQALCFYAASYGNAARFITHRY